MYEGVFQLHGRVLGTGAGKAEIEEMPAAGGKGILADASHARVPDGDRIDDGTALEQRRLFHIANDGGAGSVIMMVQTHAQGAAAKQRMAAHFNPPPVNADAHTSPIRISSLKPSRVRGIAAHREPISIIVEN